MAAKYFEELEIWKVSRELTCRIYKLTMNGLFSKDYELKSQIRSAAVSIMSNIAEGYERGGNQEFVQFLSIAKGSSGEVRSQLYVALDHGYVCQEECEQMIDSCKKLSIMINNFMKYLKSSGYKGAKYKMSKQNSTVWTG
jgi:four helix bundle protein